MKILIDEMNPDAIKLKGDKKVFKEHPNRLYFAVCLMKDNSFEEIWNNFINMIETKLLTFDISESSDYTEWFNKHDELDENNKRKFPCYCVKKLEKRNITDICFTIYLMKKMENIQDSFVNTKSKQKSFLQFLSKNKIASFIFVIDCENITNISEINTIKKLNKKKAIFSDLSNQTLIIGNILSNLHYFIKELREAKSIDIYIDYWSILTKKTQWLTKYVKSSLKKALFSYSDIEKNVLENDINTELEEVKRLKDIFKFIPKKFHWKNKASIHFVHASTDPMILLPDLILKSYKRLYLNSVDEQENLKLFNGLAQIPKNQNFGRINVHNMFCDIDKIKKENSNTSQDKYCTWENFLQKNTKEKLLIWNESSKVPWRLCWRHQINQANQFAIFKSIKKRKKFFNGHLIKKY